MSIEILLPKQLIVSFHLSYFSVFVSRLDSADSDHLRVKFIYISVCQWTLTHSYFKWQGSSFY